MNPLEFNKSIYSRPETALAVYETIAKMYQHFGNHNHIQISTSGGSDSDCIIHLVCKYFPEYLEKVDFVFVDTGLEYDATRRHISDLKSNYSINIQKIRGLSVVTSCKRYGFPILNKVKAHYIDMYRRRTPKGHYLVFEAGKHGADKYMPLFWWSNAVKADFKQAEQIRFSDCYEVYGMQRTGCVGCPFGKYTAHELRVMREYEPKLYKAVMHVFGQAYELTDRFNCRRKKCLPDCIKGEQI